MASPSQLRVLTVHKGENNQATIFRLERGWTLHFVLGANLADRNVRVFTNHPTNSQLGPNRHVYRELGWKNFSDHKSDVYDNFAEVHIVLAGSFNYYFTIDGSDQKANANGSGYFLVDPTLRYGKYDEKLPLDCITCQTIIAKNMGPFSEWEGRLRVTKETGYNMVHFTPTQELGKSNSAYALKDQLLLNPVYSTPKKKANYADVDKLVKMMRNDWEMLSLTDLVYNHTANESPWIQQHPECVYNVVNSPHLKPAYLLDRALWHFSLEVGDELWQHRGIPAEIRTEDHLNAIRAALFDVVLPKHKIHEYYQVSVEDSVQNFRSAVLSGVRGDDRHGTELCIIPDPKYRRLRGQIDVPLAVKLFFNPQPHHLTEDERVNASCDAIEHELHRLNQGEYDTIQSHLVAAVDNVIANARWRFVDGHGPRVAKVHAEEPIMWNYFMLPKHKMSVEREEELMHTDQGAFCMAHNGWVMNDDPLRNFAEPGSWIYLRRELLPWGDSVKLRYGQQPEDCPFLWEHMRKYTVHTAKIFHGVRLDNCHSTPIHVAEYMLDEARKVRPDLYVIAELFTSSEYKDNIFINRLGINSLIRESLTAYDSHDLGHLVHRYGGFPVGAFIQPPARPLMPSLAHAIFMDQTHDNESPVEKRTALDLLPSAALVAMTCSATGSNRGYDELVPHHINVVTEPRVYQSWTEDPRANTGLVNRKSGIVEAKRALNTLHQQLGQAGFNQVYVDQVDKDIVSVTRHNPVSHQSVILVARTVFGQPHSMETGFVPPLCIPGLIDEIVLEARVAHRSPAHKDAAATTYKKHSKFINGLPDYQLTVREHLKVSESDMVELKQTGDQNVQEVDFMAFPPGSVIAFKVSLNTSTKTAVLKVRQSLSQFGYRVHTLSARNLEDIKGTEMEDSITAMSLSDLNRVLYRCDAEEKDDGKGFGAYDVPGHGALPYCGLQGLMSVLNKIRSNNNLGHAMCENLRNGDWLLQYLANRLKAHQGTAELGKWFEGVFGHLTLLPRYMIPCYFDAIITGVYMIVMEVAWAKMTKFVSNGSTFVRALGMGSIQMCSVVKTAPLPILSPNLAPPHPPNATNEDTNGKEQACVTMAAGLPHFGSGIFRNWGRDTFIALRGLLLLTGRHDEARFLILAYAACLRHGLIPNLLGEGTHARFNCRDAIWWWLQCIQDYCKTVPDGASLLKDKVSRIFPSDDSAPEGPGICDQPLHDVIQEALQRHAEGVQYRERHAGPAIDSDMQPEGFNVSVGVNWDTGFVYGGNVHNCGTWMDKMGSSHTAHNHGQPATPRDGSAVEIVGLCKSAVRWLAEMSAQGLYPHSGVDATSNDQKVKVTFKEWDQKIQKSFEQHFWIGTDEVSNEHEARPDLVNQRGIYKDCYGAGQAWTDYQLRPNFPIAMVVAPELFVADHAWTALTTAREHLLGPLGMKTLDSSDWNYNGHYINSDDSDVHGKAKGFNYHQGPEWVWPIGFFLRAQLHFAHQMEPQHHGLLKDTSNFVKSTLSNHRIHLQQSDWRSMPELTNQNGAHCADSCPAQAWSMGCLLEVLYDMEQLVTH